MAYRRHPACFIMLGVGVGNNPNSFSRMRGANVSSGYALPFRVIPERGQVSENGVKPSSKQCCDVFHDDETGSKLANQSGVFNPEAATLSGDAQFEAGA